MSDAMNRRSLGHGHRLLQAIGALPAEVETRHREQNLFFAVGINRLVKKIFAAQMHMRHEIQDIARFFELEARFELKVVVSGRNAESRVVNGPSLHPPLRRLLGKDHPDRGTIFIRFAVRRVMHLKD